MGNLDSTQHDYASAKASIGCASEQPKDVTDVRYTTNLFFAYCRGLANTYDIQQSALPIFANGFPKDCDMHRNSYILTSCCISENVGDMQQTLVFLFSIVVEQDGFHVANVRYYLLISTLKKGAFGLERMQTC